MDTPFTSTQQTALRGILHACLWTAAHVLLLLLILAAAGCLNKTGQHIAEAQKPGIATGAGATLTGPANSATPTTQLAQRRIAYYPPQREPLPRYAPASIPVISTNTPAPIDGSTVPAGVESPTSAASFPQPPAPAWIDERTETTLGQHQDAAGLIKAATAIGSWGRARWLGILCLLFAAFALAWAHNNPEGYPLVAWKVGAVGLFLALFDPSPWWLLLLLLPAAFYVAQKLKLINPTLLP